VEDEINDGAARFSKLRPMRVEMYCKEPSVVAMGFRIKYGMTRKDECNALQRTAGRQPQTEMILAVRKLIMNYEL